MEPHISVYAELRSYIRAISVAVSLPSPSDSSTRLTIAADGVTVRVSHRGDTRHLSLPAKTALGVTSIPAQKQGVTTVEWRLPLGADDAFQYSMAHDGTPLWSAMDLEAGSGVGCRKCGASVIIPGSVAWKDLPSENWAEMMDFWHCHKPADHGQSHEHYDTGKADEASLAARGYGASSTISAQNGIGFVDLTTLLFSKNDCHGLTVSLHALYSVSQSPLLGYLFYYTIPGHQEGSRADLWSSMAWIPIQLPNINNARHFLLCSLG
jgi:ubiquitin-protein ligase E3 D